MESFEQTRRTRNRYKLATDNVDGPKVQLLAPPLSSWVYAVDESQEMQRNATVAKAETVND